MFSASGRLARPLKILSLWLFPFPNTAGASLSGRSPAQWHYRFDAAANCQFSSDFGPVE